jgi:hypothetical protein
MLRRSMTPSELPDFPDYQECWDEKKSPSDMDFDVEKSPNPNKATFYEESSDDEDEIEVAKSAAVQTTMKPLSIGKRGPRKWFRRK